MPRWHFARVFVRSLQYTVCLYGIGTLTQFEVLVVLQGESNRFPLYSPKSCSFTIVACRTANANYRAHITINSPLGIRGRATVDVVVFDLSDLVTTGASGTDCVAHAFKYNTPSLTFGAHIEKQEHCNKRRQFAFIRKLPSGYSDTHHILILNNRLYTRVYIYTRISPMRVCTRNKTHCFHKTAS